MLRKCNSPTESFHRPINHATRIRYVSLTSLQKGDFFTTETTEIAETKDNFIFSSE